MSTAPVAFELMENAISLWLRATTGVAVYFVEREDSGAPEPPPPRAQIRHLTLVTISQPSIRKIPSIVQQRYTVTAGPGTVGVDFYTGTGATALDATTISTAVGAVTADVAALALLAELDADLPAGVTAMIDPEDDASVLVDGSAVVPLFAATGLGLTSVATTRERFPELEASWSRWSWRVSFYGHPTRGFGTAADMQARAKAGMRRIFEPLAKKVGWEMSGILADLDNLPNNRKESRAVLDFALEGYATQVFQVPAARSIGIDLVTHTI